MIICKDSETNIDNLSSCKVVSMNTDQSILASNDMSGYFENLSSEENCDHQPIPNVVPSTDNRDVDNNDSNIDRYGTHSCIILDAADNLTGNATIECPCCKNCYDDTQQEPKRNKSLHCSKCDESFNEFNLYKKHLSTHQDNLQFNCGICNTIFSIENNYKVHMALHGNSLVCPICELSFQRKASLKSHLAIHQVEEYYKCPECASEFENEGALEKHMETHLIEDININHKLICRYCKVHFDNESKLKHHISGHLKIKKLVLNVKKSKREESSNQGKKHRCNVCDKSFPKSSLLQRHVRIHNGERPFVCPICSRGFTQKVSLKIHLLKHTGIKPFCCTLCPAKFYQKCNLKVHVEKTHSAKEEGEKKFKCSQCDCIFKRLSSLNAHMRKTHADYNLINITTVIDQLKNLEKQLDGKCAERNQSKNQKEAGVAHKLEEPVRENGMNQNCKVYSLMQKFNGTNKVYVCSYCSKETKKPSDMIRHIRTHTKERPFKCHCGCFFAYKASLETHMKKHSGKKCEKCSKVITSSKQWKVHLRKHSQGESLESKNIKLLGSSNKGDGALHNQHTDEQIHTLPRSYDSSPILKESEPKYIRLDNVNNKYLSKHSYPTEPYECPYCRKKFRDFLMCRKHIDSHKTQENEVHELNAKGWSENISINIFEKQLGTQDVVICDDSSKFQLIEATEADSIEKSVQTVNQEKSTSDSLQILDTEQNHNIQTILVTCPEVQSEDFLTEFILSKSDNSIILDTVTEKNRESPIIFNVQTINVTDVSIINEDIFGQEYQEKSADPVLSITNQRNSPPLESTDSCGQMDIGDSFLSNNISLYPNPRNNPNERSKINSDIPTDNPNADNTLQLKITNESQETFSLSMIHCLVCKKMFESLEPYLTHMKTCGSTSCEKLKEETIKKSEEEPVESTKVIEKPAKAPAKKNLCCVICEKEFINRGIYLKHINSHHKEENGMHKCKFCNKEFKKFSDLGRHLRTHTGEKPFECNQCGKKFTLKSTLENHYRTHDPIATKNFVCEVCNSFFTTNASRKLHMRFHTGSKPYKCTFCDQYFRTAAHRKCHEMKIHLNYQKKNTIQRSSKKITNILATAVDMVVNEIKKSNKSFEQNDSPTYPEIKVNISGPKCDSETISIDPTLSQIQGSNILLQEMGQELLACSRSTEYLASDTISVEDHSFPETHTVKNLFSIDEDALKETTELHLKKCCQCNLCFLSNEELSNHEKTHPANVSYKCFICNVDLVGVQQLKTHLRSVHKIVEPASQLIL